MMHYLIKSFIARFIFFKLIQIDKIVIYLIIFFSLFFSNRIKSQELHDTRKFVFYPKSYSLWEFQITAGLSLTKIPMNVVEEEINQSPMPEIHCRFGLPYNLSLTSELKSNYIANYGSLGLKWTFWDKIVDLSLGGKFNAWFGHLELESIKLKAEGMIISPTVGIGFDFNDFLLSINFETQTNRMWTQIDDKEIAKKDHKLSGIALDINIEQPLWKDNYVVLGIKMNYVKFFYQSWLSYNTIDEYLLYPEFKFAFIL